MEINYTVPDYIKQPTNRQTVASNMAYFLMANGKGIFDTWAGKMKAADQRKVFGLFLGKGTIRIEGEIDRVDCLVKIAYGQDIETSVSLDCQSGTISRSFYAMGEPGKHEQEIIDAATWFHP